MPSVGDPEVRIRIPLRGTLSTRISERDGVVIVRVGHFLSLSVALEIHDALAASKLAEAMDVAGTRLTEIAAQKAAQRPKKGARKR